MSFALDFQLLRDIFLLNFLPNNIFISYLADAHQETLHDLDFLFPGTQCSKANNNQTEILRTFGRGY